MRALLAMLAILIGCGPELPSPTKIDSLRVLAIRAEPPEVAPGGIVTLSSLVVDPKKRDVAYTWTACVVPERGTGFFGAGGGGSGASGAGGYGISDAGSCAAGDGVKHLGNASAATIIVPEDFLDDPTTLARAYGFPEDAPLPPPVKAFLLGTAGVNLTVALVVVAGDERVESYKRVNVSLATDMNKNPTDVALHMTPKDSGVVAPTTALPPGDGRCILGEQSGLAHVGAGEFVLSAVNVPDPPVSYTVIAGGNNGKVLDVVTTTETLFYSFFSTQGSFDRAILKSGAGETQTWTLDGDVSGPVPLWVVVRDGRGGTTWCESSLPAQ